MKLPRGSLGDRSFRWLWGSTLHCSLSSGAMADFGMERSSAERMNAPSCAAGAVPARPRRSLEA